MLRKFFGLDRQRRSHTRPPVARPQPRKPRRWRPDLEPLESRLTPVCTHRYVAPVLDITCTVPGDVTTVDLNTSTVDGVAYPLLTTNVGVHGEGSNTVRVLDTFFLWGDTYTISDGDTISGTGLRIASLPRFALSYKGTGALDLRTGPGSDTVNVRGMPVGTSVLLDTGAGDDTINLGNTKNRLDPIANVTVTGGAGNDTLRVIDSGWFGGDHYYVTQSTVAVEGLPPFKVTYGAVENLTLATGPGNDTICIESIAAGTTVTVNAGAGNNTIKITPAAILGHLTLEAGGGTNTIDFSGCNGGGGSCSPSTPGIYLNMETREVGGVPGGLTFDPLAFRNVVGTNCDDIIVGIGGGSDPPGLDNWFQGLDGRDILIGGRGRDTLDGGDGDDLLIHGTTSYDSSRAALLFFQSVWSSTVLNYLARFALLGNPATMCSPGIQCSLDDANLGIDTMPDSLTGGEGHDWFIVEALAERRDYNPTDDVWSLDT